MHALSQKNPINRRVIGSTRTSLRIAETDFLSDEQLRDKFQNDADGILQAYIHVSVAHNSVEDESRYRVPKLMIQDKSWPWRKRNNLGEKDCTFIVGTRSIAIHRFLLQMESTVYATMLQTKHYLESATGEFVIEDFTFPTVRAFVQFCYGEDISDYLNSTTRRMDLLRFADKYDMPNVMATLEEFSATKIRVTNVAQNLECATKYNAKLLKTACEEFLAQQ
uniref:BTB domain-containing protein n=1 Tax=Panagrolaimus superbus TaxID=310955 RepID=A0A914YV42_9BILA